MAGGVGFPMYPQQPSPTAAEVGSQAEAAAQQRQLAALARTRPGYLPYTGAGIGGALRGPQVLPSGAPTSPVSGEDQTPMGPGIGGALMARKQAHAQHLASLGMSDEDVQTFTQGGQ